MKGLIFILPGPAWGAQTVRPENGLGKRVLWAPLAMWKAESYLSPCQSPPRHAGPQQPLRAPHAMGSNQQHGQIRS